MWVGVYTPFVGEIRYLGDPLMAKKKVHARVKKNGRTNEKVEWGGHDLQHSQTRVMWGICNTNNFRLGSRSMRLYSGRRSC